MECQYTLQIAYYLARHIHRSDASYFTMHGSRAGSACFISSVSVRGKHATNPNHVVTHTSLIYVRVLPEPSLAGCLPLYAIACIRPGAHSAWTLPCLPLLSPCLPQHARETPVCFRAVSCQCLADCADCDDYPFSSPLTALEPATATVYP